MDRLFLDANILFTAAHNVEGKAAFLFDALEFGHWRLISSAYAIEEARRNIARKYPDRLGRLELLANQVLTSAQPTSSSLPVALPEKDRPIFLAACAAAATHLLTGDMQHFGPHMNQPGKTEGIIIQSVGDYLQRIAVVK